jgi:hypothetical protein
MAAVTAARAADAPAVMASKAATVLLKAVIRNSALRVVAMGPHVRVADVPKGAAMVLRDPVADGLLKAVAMVLRVPVVAGPAVALVARVPVEDPVVALVARVPVEDPADGLVVPAVAHRRNCW